MTKCNKISGNISRMEKSCSSNAMGQNATCYLYVEDKNDDDIWEEPRRDTGPVYVAAALEWVQIGPTLQGRRGICYEFKLSILNCSADWQNAKHCHCTARCRETERIYGVAQFAVFCTSSGGTEQLQWMRMTGTIVQFFVSFCRRNWLIGCLSLFCSEGFQCSQFCNVLVQVMCSWRTCAPVFCPIALRFIHRRQPYKEEVLYVDVLTVICYFEQAQARRWDAKLSHYLSASIQSSVLSAWFASCSLNGRQYVYKEAMCTYGNWFRYYDFKLRPHHFISCIFTQLTGDPFAGTHNRVL